MNKKFVGLFLATILLAGCTVGGTTKKKKKSSSSSTSQEVQPRVTNVSLNRQSITFNLNPDHLYTVETLIPTVEGEGDFDKSLTWTSSNEQIATVVNGLVTGLNLGETQITATSKANKDYSAVCQIKVENDVPTVTSVKISPENPTLDLYTAPNKQLQLTALVEGEHGPSQAVTWAISSTTKATIDENGVVTGKATGTATITATSKVDTNKKATTTLTVTDTTPKVNSVSVTATGGATLTNKAYHLDVYGSDKKSVQLAAEVSVTNSAPQTVNWTSSNSSLVDVDSNGLVTLKTTAEQTSPIKITATSTYDSSKSDYANIYVDNSTPRVTSVSVSLSTPTLKMGATATATASVSAVGLTEEQKKVTWSCDKPSVASIDANTGAITPVSVGDNVTITATSNYDNTKKGSATLNVVEATKGDAYTVLMYVCGADLESGSKAMWGGSEGGEASSDIKEVLAATQTQPEDVNVVIQTGGSSKWNKIGSVTPSSSKLERFEVKQNVIERVSSLTNASMGNSSTLQSFVEWGIQNYYAEHMALIFWNHGGGLDGCCYDENYDEDGLTEIEISNALTNAFKNASYTEKFEWIGFDCCLKQNFEEAIFNANYAKYQVASQISEWGEGWNYTPWINELYKNPAINTGTLLSTICEEFVAAYDEYGSENVMTLSWLDLAKIDTFVQAFKTFTSGCTYTSIKNTISKTITFDGDYHCYDLGNILVALGATDGSNVLNAFSQLVGDTVYRNNASEMQEMNVSYKTYKPKGLDVFIAKTSYVSKSIYQQLASSLGDWYTANYNNM